ncbi:MAG: NUDIX domain-containing protein [Bacteroidales bacterium]|nr:NUDIX domain-containing protein [Bacteroidales bacterium]
MNKTELLKKLLPGFLPLFVFIAADEIWGTEIGLIVALVFGIIQLGYIFIKEKRLDKFVFFDTLLIIALGGVSILLENDIFFKLKPGLINLILVAVLGLSAFSKVNLMQKMSQRYIKGIEINEQAVKKMKQSMKLLFWIFLVHTALIFYSAFYLSKEAWVFISGGLFYIIFGVYFVFELIKNKYAGRISSVKVPEGEWLPIVNEEGRVVGKASRNECHSGKKLLHPVVHLHVINSKKMIYLQKRPENKEIQPGMWDTAVGGHVAFGENIEQALKREAKEEIGLENFNASLLSNYKWETEVEHELVFMFLTKHDGRLFPNPQELEEGKYWTKKQIEANLGGGVFTPNFEKEYKILKDNGL